MNRYAVPASFLAFSAAFLAAAYGYGEASRQVPVAIGFAGLLLAFVDLLTRLPTPLGRKFAQWLGSGPETDQPAHSKRSVALAREVGAIASIIGFVAATLTLGLLVATPAYVYGYIVFWGGRSRWHGLLAAAGATAFTYLLFEVVLHYPLYRGMLFD